MSKLLKTRRGHDSEDDYSDTGTDYSTEIDDESIHSISDVDQSDFDYEDDTNDSYYSEDESDEDDDDDDDEEESDGDDTEEEESNEQTAQQQNEPLKENITQGLSVSFFSQKRLIN